LNSEMRSSRQIKGASRRRPANSQNAKNNYTDGTTSSPNAVLVIPKSVKFVMPDRLVTGLLYNLPGNLPIQTTKTSFGYRLRPTSAYDIDPVLGSVAAPGFTELAAIYGSYRVLSSKIRISFANTSTAQSAICVVVPLLIDPGSAPSDADVTSWLSNPYSRHKLCGTAGSPASTISCSMSTEKLYGSKMVYFDDNWAGPTNGTTNNNWYWAFAAVVAAVPASIQTINVCVDVSLEVEFYSRKVLAN